MKSKILLLLRLLCPPAAMLVQSGCHMHMPVPGIDPNSTVLNTSITAGPEPVTPSHEAVFRFGFGPSGASVTAFHCRLDGGPVISVPAPDALTLSGLSDGVHSLTAAAFIVGTGEVDTTPAVFTWSVGTVTAIGVDPAFTGAGGGPLTRVGQVVVQGDGKIIVTGNRFTAGGISRAQIARLNADGSLDESFDAGLELHDTLIEAVAVQPDGRIVVAGSFTSWNGVPRGRIARLMPDGSLDPGFPAGAGANGTVRCVAVQRDGRIILAGDFSRIAGMAGPNTGVARLHPNGTVDGGFYALEEGAFSTLALQRDGKIIIGGYLQASVGVPETRKIIRLLTNGDRDATFTDTIHSADYVQVVCLQPDGRILVAGLFSGLGGPAGGLRRYSTTGELEPPATFNPGEVSGIRSIAVQADGQIIIGGSFEGVGGAFRGGVARLFGNGALESTDTFNTELGAAPAGEVDAVALQPDGRVLLGGRFTTMNGVPAMNIARLTNSPATSVLTGGRWLLNGTAPVVDQVQFQIDTGSGWTDAGPVTFDPGNGWGIAAPLPERGVLRVIGRTSARTGNAGLIRQDFALAPPEQLWRERTFGGQAGNEAVAGPQADADGDGVSNLMEYAAGSDPLRASRVPSVAMLPDATGLSIIYERALAATDVDMVVEQSADLTTWAPASFTETELSRTALVRTMQARVTTNPAARRAFARATVNLLSFVPSLVVCQPAAQRLANGLSTVDFGSVVTGGSAAKTFTLKNAGHQPLTVSAIALSGAHASDFSLTPPALPLLLPPGAEGTLAVTYLSGTTGARTAFLEVTSTDPDDTVYRIPLTAAGAVLMAPEITVEQPAGTNLSDGATVNCGTVNPLQVAPERLFTVRNTGNVPLDVSSISVSGLHGDDFILSGAFVLPSALAPGEALTFQMFFYPGAGGNRSATLSIVSNDADEGTFDISLTGRGNTPPQLQLPASPLVVPATSPAGAVVSFSVTASDEEDVPPPTPVVSRASGTQFQIGDTTVNATVTDSLGRTAAGSFIVRVHPVPAPGTLALWGLDSPVPGETFTSLLVAPSINASGLCGFPAWLSDGSAGLFTGTQGSVGALAVTGTQAPGTAAGTTFNYFPDGVPLPLNASGQTAFAGWLTGAGVDSENDTGLWRGAAGGVQLLARESQAAPGTGAGVFFSDFYYNPVLNDSGVCAFPATLTGPGVGVADYAGLWTGQPGSLALLARLGAPAPGAAGETFVTLNPPRLSATGHCLFTGTTSVTGDGIWAGIPGSVVLVALVGAQAPGLPAGVNFTTWFTDRLNQSRPVINGQNRIAFAARLDTTLIPPGTDRSLWTGPANAPVALVRSGTAAPGAPAGMVFTDFGSPLLNGTGAVTFHARFAPAPDDPVSGDGIWRGTPGSLTKVVRSGDAAPGAGAGAEFALCNGGAPGVAVENIAVNDSGETVFMAQLAGPGVTTENDDSLWHASAAGVLTLLAREGDTLTPSPGDPRTVYALSFAGTYPGGSSGLDGQPSGLSASGQTTFRATFTDGTSAILVRPRP